MSKNGHTGVRNLYCGRTVQSTAHGFIYSLPSREEVLLFYISQTWKWRLEVYSEHSGSRTCAPDHQVIRPFLGTSKHTGGPFSGKDILNCLGIFLNYQPSWEQELRSLSSAFTLKLSHLQMLHMILSSPCVNREGTPSMQDHGDSADIAQSPQTIKDMQIDSTALNLSF